MLFEREDFNSNNRINSGVIVFILQYMIVYGHTPRYHLTSTIISISLSKCDNNRGISLFIAICKVFIM